MDDLVAEVLCAERCAQAGDPPCSRICDDGHCDECIGMAKAVLERFAIAPADEIERLRARVAELEATVNEWAGV